MSDLTFETTDGGYTAVKRDGETVHLIPTHLLEEIRRPQTRKGYVEVERFIEEGYLQEVNRQFLHPLGLALTVAVNVDDDTGEEKGPWYLAGVQDYRSDLEGMIFTEIDPVKVDNVAKQAEVRREVREKALGYWVQPG